MFSFNPEYIRLKSLFIILSTLSFLSCNQQTADDYDTSPIVARAGNEKLSMDDFKDDFISPESEKDSSHIATKIIENWAIDALFYQEALDKLDEDERRIDREVDNYRKSLVNYIYQSKIVEANLDTNISRKEIEDYYNEHSNNFILNENIIKVNYFKIPVKAQGLDKIKKLLYAANPKDAEQLRSLCIQNAENFFMLDSTWLLLDDIKKEIPKLKDQSDLNISIGKIVEFTDSQYYYYLKVKDLKTKNSKSPINFERQNIKNFVINNRKTQLIKQYKLLLLEKAKTNKSFETY